MPRFRLTAPVAPFSALARSRKPRSPVPARAFVKGARCGLALALGLGLAGALGLGLSPQQAKAQSRALTGGSGVAGPFLAARHASGGSDYKMAALYFARALGHDPRNPRLLESAVLSKIAAGEVQGAAAPASVLESLQGDSQIAALTLVVDDAIRGDFPSVLARLEGRDVAGAMIESLMKAWAELGRGRMSEAETAFDAAIAAEGGQIFGLYHKAMALASVGDFEGAEAILADPRAQALRSTRAAVMARAQILSQLERDDAALALLADVFGPGEDPALEALRADLQAGKMVPFTLVRSARDGMAELFYSLASALSAGSPDVLTLAYARFAEALRPDHPDSLLLVAGLLEQHGQYGLATESYDRIPASSPEHPVAELGRAEALTAAGRAEEAISVLKALAKDQPKSAVVQASLGDSLRRLERYEEAVVAYDAAIATFARPERGQWSVYYARGICHERQKRFDQSEADMRKALDLNPDQPQVLNYLGYSFLERNRNMDEALAMIERAVAARPDDGYIVDSLAWAFYRMGRYGEAIAPMERAAELEPADPIVNDHLGDVLWAVGRKREAEFQWRRALSFKPESEDEAARIRAKLAKGLDAVLADEGKAPLHMTQNQAASPVPGQPQKATP